MGTVNLQWAADGTIDSYSIYRDTAPINPESLPEPLATGVLVKNYQDAAVVEGETYYYRVASIKGGANKVSAEQFEIKAGGDPHWDKVIFYSRFNGNANDLSIQGNIPVLGANVSYGTAGAKFEQALYANGNIQECVNYPATHMGFAEGEDFTIEAWVCCTLKPTGFYYSPVGTWAANAGWCFFFTPNGLTFNFGGVGLGEICSYEINNIYSICVTRKAGVIRLFFNGSVIKTLVNNSAIADNQLRVGGNLTTTDFWHGYIDEFRITKGVARYTENYDVQLSEFYDF